VDAKLLADYMARTGRFAQDEELFGAIQKAEAAGAALNWASDEAVVLQKVVGKALQTVYPVTLHDFKSTWQSDANYGGSMGPRARSLIAKCFVIAATAYVVLLCASLTVWQQRATSVVSELAGDKIGQQEKAFDDLLVLIGSDKLADLKNPASPLRETFRQKQREIQGIQRSIEADYFTLERLSSYRSPNDYIGWAIGGALRAVSAGAAPATVPPVSADEAPIEASAPAPQRPGVTQVVATPGGAIRILSDAEKAQIFLSAGSGASDCDLISRQYSIDKSNAVLNTSSDENAIRSLRLFMSAVDFDKAFVQRMKCQLDGNPVAPMLSAFDMKYRLDVMSLWWLPALYGALGALIYHLRDFLNGTRPDPTLLKMIVRVGLGAFAGIAIGWFWMPQDPSVLGIPELSFTPLSLAFIVGFGIDAFVALLDRIVVGVTRAVAGPA
jgi:hypothetical protein